MPSNLKFKIFDLQTDLGKRGKEIMDATALSEMDFTALSATGNHPRKESGMHVQ